MVNTTGVRATETNPWLTFNHWLGGFNRWLRINHLSSNRGLVASISHFLTAAMKFSCFSSNEIRLPSPFSVIHVKVSIKNNVAKDMTLFLFLSF